MRKFAARCAVLAALTTGFSTACDDAPTQPAVLVAPETRAAIRVASTLPNLPALLDKADRNGSFKGAPSETRARLDRARSLWNLSDVLGDSEEASRVRAQAYVEAVPALSQALSERELEQARRRLTNWADLAQSVLKPGAIPGFAEALGEARALVEQSREASAAGNRDNALAALLLASDRLDATTPRGVATTLTRNAEESLARITSHTRRDESVERAQRLVRGAREALLGGDYELAIRRAFYAEQMIGRLEAVGGVEGSAQVR